MKVFAERLKKLADERNMTAKEVGKLTGISEEIVNDYMEDERNPLAADILMLAKKLDVTVDWLLGVDDDSTTEK